MVTEAELITKISEYIRNNTVLCPDVFDGHGQVHDHARQGLLKISKFLIEQSQKAFSSLKVEDVILCGGITTYIYNDETDIDLGVIIRPESANYDPSVVDYLFNKINRAFPKKGYNFFLGKRNIDYGLVERSCLLSGSRFYSLQENCWHQMPVYREFPYHSEELLKYYKTYCDKVYLFANQLEKIDEKILTYDSCKKLQQYLKNMKNEALLLKENGDEQEYSIEYNAYRLFNRFGIRKYFETMISDSKNHLINILEMPYE